MYHNVVASRSTDKYSAPVAMLRKHLALISQKGYKVISLSELLTLGVQHERSVVITFDDGLRSAFEYAFPLLRDAGFRAEFFISTAYIGERERVSWANLHEMQRAGMGIQSHGHFHVDLSRLRRESLLKQLTWSRQLLEQRLGIAVEFFSVPYGLLPPESLEAAEMAGYRGVCTSGNWVAKPGACLIPRIAVQAGTSAAAFVGLLEVARSVYLRRSLRSAMLWAPKRMLLRFAPQILGVAVMQDADDEESLAA